MPSGKIAFLLHFNSRIDRARSRLTLQGGDKAGGSAPSVLPVPDVGHPDVMTTSADLAAGAYTLRWQVLAVDGHITRGEVPFTVTAKP